jgi:hypothetical protein
MLPIILLTSCISLWMNFSSNMVKTRTLITMRTLTSTSSILRTLIMLKQSILRISLPMLFKYPANNLTKLNCMSQLWERTTYPKPISTCSWREWSNLLRQRTSKRSKCSNSSMVCLLEKSALVRFPTLKWHMKKASFKAALIYHLKLKSQENYHLKW